MRIPQSIDKISYTITQLKKMAGMKRRGSLCIPFFDVTDDILKITEYFDGGIVKHHYFQQALPNVKLRWVPLETQTLVPPHTRELKDPGRRPGQVYKEDVDMTPLEKYRNDAAFDRIEREESPDI